MTLKHAWLALALLPFVAPQMAQAETVRVYVTNSAGDSIHVIDPATNKVVQEIKGTGGDARHRFSPRRLEGLCQQRARPDARRVRPRDGKLTKKVPLSAHPNNIAVAKDGRIVVGIARGKGALDIIDPVELRIHRRRSRSTAACTTSMSRRTASIAVTGSIPKKHRHRRRSRDRGDGLGAQSRPRRPPDDHRGQSRRLDQADVRPAVRLQRLRGGRFRRPQGDRAHHAAAHIGRVRHRSRPQHRALARHRRRPRRQDAVGHQHSQQRGLRLFARRPQARRRGRAAGAQAARPQPDRLGAELGHVHARQQDGLRFQRRRCAR